VWFLFFVASLHEFAHHCYAPVAEPITETASVSAPSAPEKSHWQARLQLGFSKDAEPHA
jgi:hypothetical protein